MKMSPKYLKWCLTEKAVSITMCIPKFVKHRGRNVLLKLLTPFSCLFFPKKNILLFSQLLQFLISS